MEKEQEETYEQYEPHCENTDRRCICDPFHGTGGRAAQVPESHDPRVDARPEDVRIRYARSTLRLAEVELKIALTGNERIMNLYTARTVQRLRNNVAYAQEMLRYESDRGSIGLHKLHLRESEGELAMAQSELESAVAVNRQQPGSISHLEIERLRAVKEVARLALEKAREPAAMKTPLVHLQNQLDRMRSELTRMHVLIDKVASH